MEKKNTKSISDAASYVQLPLTAYISSYVYVCTFFCFFHANFTFENIMDSFTDLKVFRVSYVKIYKIRLID